MHTVLVPLTGSNGDAAALEVAGAVAKEFGSHVEALFVRFDPAQARGAVSLGGQTMVAEWLAGMEYRDASHARHARALFDRFLVAHDMGAGGPPGTQTRATGEWRETSGEFIRTVVNAAHYCDLVACAPSAQEGIGRAELAAILLASGRPLLLASDAAPRNIAHTIVVAWKNTREAAHALTAAMPILEKARRVVVITANEEDQDPVECVGCAERMASQLRWHGVKAESRMIVLAGRDAAGAVFDSANEFHADLLVMGGYGHSRGRETVFGGFTHRALEGAPIPVFICH